MQGAQKDRIRYILKLQSFNIFKIIKIIRLPYVYICFHISDIFFSYRSPFSRLFGQFDRDHEVGRFDRPAEKDRENARRHRIERAGVTDPRGVVQFTHGGDYAVGRDSGMLVYDEDTADGIRFLFSAHQTAL